MKLIFEKLLPGSEEGFTFKEIRSRRFSCPWHLTNVCGQRCRHCYDRSAREELSWEEAEKVLESLGEFCRRHQVRPQVSLTGGDPLCSPHFWRVYQEVARRGWEVSVLGKRGLEPSHLRPAC